ncbi:MAG: hypothetical protein H7210_06375 [Pyrinomonadaceae bacterium]|nr:hypothetical protein [Phycisphaerales bacterium]
MALNQIKPGSMFHRRLLLIGGLLALGMIAPVWRLGSWTLVRGDEQLAHAEEYLVNWQWLPTRRGRILDRQGRVLAQDRPSYNVAVDYRVMTGQWAVDQARRRARKLNREEWPKLTRAQRRDLTEQYLPDLEARLESMWAELCRMGGISRDELDLRINEIKKNVQASAAAHRKNKLATLENKAIKAGVEADVTPSQLEDSIVEETSPHVLLHDVDDETAFTFIRMTQSVDVDADDSAAPMPGVSVMYAGTREYPMSEMDIVLDRSTFPSPLRSDVPLRLHVDGIGTHVVGWMRGRVFAEDNKGKSRLMPDKSPDRSFYLDGESIGHAGLERAAEADLRGLRGTRTVKLDTREKVEIPPVHGRDVQLTLDTDLQARIQGLLSPEAGLTVVQPWHTVKHPTEGEQPKGVPTLGERLASAVVVIKVDTGEVISMVTSPTFTRAELQSEPETVYQDAVLTPAVNRTISQPYAPGSIVKPLVLCAAATGGVYSTSEQVACTGHFYADKPNMLRCWIEKMGFGMTHSTQFQHDLNGSDAIMVSCNIFFYEMGKRLGVKGISEWFTKFGVGPDAQRWDLGLGYEYEGDLPDPDASGPTDGILLGIGQGQIAWTPMHAADAYATIARAGIKIKPRLRTDAPVVTTDLHLDPRAVEQAISGLGRSVSEYDGTTNHIRVPMPGGLETETTFNVVKEPGIHVWAKSGTADASALVSEGKDGKKFVVRDGDHAWCVLLCGDEASGGARPKYAVAVVVDYGGSGGRVAGPIANQVVRLLLEDGYLVRSEGTRDEGLGSREGAGN